MDPNWYSVLGTKLANGLWISRETKSVQDNGHGRIDPLDIVKDHGRKQVRLNEFWHAEKTALPG